MARPLILAFTADPLLEEALNRGAEAVGFAVETVASTATLAPAGGEEVPNEPGEPIHGRDGSIFSQIVARQPSMIVIDLDNRAITWRKWIALLKSSPATRRTPIAAVASRVDGALRREARGHGADLVATTERFAADLQKIIPELARVADTQALVKACDEPLLPLAREGLALFNAGRYFDCHEELEHAWNEDQGPGRNLYKGILQVAVAYLQIERGNYNGAVKMMLRVRQWLDPLPGRCRGVDIDRLRRDAARVHEEVLRLGPDGLAQFDRSLLKPVHYE